MAWILAVFSLILVMAQSSLGSSRIERRAGVTFGVNDPSPAMYGFNIHYNFTDYMQLQFGAGFGTDGVSESVVEEISTSLVTAMFYVMTLTLIEWDKIRDFVKDEDETLVKTIFTWGGGLNFFVPGWNISPMAGVAYAGWEAKNSPFGLSNRDRHVFYKLGVDWQTAIGIRLSAGWAHSPDLPESIRDRAFANLGYAASF